MGPSPSPLALTLADARSREAEVNSQFYLELGVGPRARAETALQTEPHRNPTRNEGVSNYFQPEDGGTRLGRKSQIRYAVALHSYKTVALIHDWHSIIHVEIT